MTTTHTFDEVVSPALIVEKTSYAPRFRSDWHDHRTAQLIYPSRGTMTIHTKAISWVVSPSRAYWLPALEPHRVEASVGLDMHSVYCQGALVRQLPKCAGIVQVSSLLRELILTLHEAREAGLCDEPTGRMAWVLADQINLQKQIGVTAPQVRSQRLRGIATALERDPCDPRSLKDWAAEIGVSARTLARAFQRETRMTFSAYRLQTRLRVAIQRIAEGEAVSSIAYDLGFSSSSNFIAMFRRATGTTPGRYFANRD
jgi:AraC-like DNA-binding protein